MDRDAWDLDGARESQEIVGRAVIVRVFLVNAKKIEPGRSRCGRSSVVSRSLLEKEKPAGAVLAAAGGYRG